MVRDPNIQHLNKLLIAVCSGTPIPGPIFFPVLEMDFARVEERVLAVCKSMDATSCTTLCFDIESTAPVFPSNFVIERMEDPPVESFIKESKKEKWWERKSEKHSMGCSPSIKTRERNRKRRKK